MSTNIITTEKYLWSNEHNNVHREILKRYQIRNTTGWKDGLAGIQQMLLDARTRMERVRSYGGKWSLSDVAVCNDNMHDTKPLTFWAPIATSVITGSPLYPNDPVPLEKRLFYFQSGAQIVQINTALENIGLCLPTTGASNGQTIAGAVSTGTHGSAMKIGAMQDFVRALHIVTAHNKHYIVQSKQAPIVSQKLADVFGAELCNDDTIFSAALVSFGSFGVIHGVILEVESLYQLETYCLRTQYSEVEGVFEILNTFNHDNSKNIIHYLNTLGIPGTVDPHHFDIIINPYSEDKNTFVRAMFKHPYSRTTLSPEPPSSTTRVGNDILSAVGSIADSVGVAIPHIVTMLFGNVAEEQNGYTQTPRNVFGDSTMYRTKNGGASVELGVPIGMAQQAIQQVVQCAKHNMFAGVIGIRFVKNSKATLAFTRFAPLTCTIELPAVDSESTQQFYQSVFAQLDTQEIPFTLHWGQQGDYSKNRLYAMYGGAVDEWVNARTKFLPDPVQRYMFTNDFLKRCGIHEAPPLVGGAPLA